MKIDPAQEINFAGRDWLIIKAWVQEHKENKVGLLITANNHDTSNQIRGALQFINSLLALESAANNAANRDR